VLLQLLQWQQGCCHCSSLFSHVHSLQPSLFCSQIIASFIGKHDNLLQHSCQIRWDKQALKYATICGINGATTCLVVGIATKWQYPNTPSIK